MARRSIAAYNAILRDIKAQTGLTQREAQAVYRGIRDRVGHTPTRAETKAHAKEAAKFAAFDIQQKKAQEEKRRLDAEKRAQAKFEKRSEAAKRGAQTRKRNEDKRRREDQGIKSGSYGEIRYEGKKSYKPKGKGK